MYYEAIVASLSLSLAAAPNVAGGAAQSVRSPSSAPAAPSAATTSAPAACDQRILSVADAADGYRLIFEGDRLTGEFGELQLDVRCASDMLRLELATSSGELVTVNLDYHSQHAVLEVEAWHPDLGWVSRLVEAELSDPLEGKITFSATTERETATVHVAFDGRVLEEIGSPGLVNAEFASALARSTTWAEAHRLAFTLFEIEPVSLAREVSELSLHAAVPDNRKGNKSIFAMGVACAKAMVGCGAAAISGLPPAAVVCYKDSVGCALSAACAWYSCID